MKKLIYIIVFVIQCLRINSQSGLDMPFDKPILKKGCSCKFRTVCKYTNKQNFRVRIIDSCSVEESKQSLRSYFVIDSVKVKKVNGKLKSDTVILNSISLKEIALHLGSDTVLNGKKDFLKLITESPLNVFFVDRELGFIYGAHNSNGLSNCFFLLRTEDGGKHWTYKSILPESGAQWPYYYWDEECIYLFNKQKGIIVFKPGSRERSYGGLIRYSYTKDGGKTWINEKIKTGHSLIDIMPSYSESGQVKLVVKYELISEDSDDRRIETEVYQSKNFGEKFKKLK